MAHDPHDAMAAVAVSPNYAQDGTVFAATESLSIKVGAFILLKSGNGGVNWSVVAGLPGNTRIASIVFSPAYAQDGTVYVAGDGGLARSADGGQSWTTCIRQGLNMVALSPDFAADNTVFAVTVARKLLKSSDRGVTWTSLPVPAALTAGLSVLAVSSNFPVDHTLLLGGVADGIFRSSTGGATWKQVVAGSDAPSVTGLAFSPDFSTDGTAFAASNGMGVLLSRDGAKTWTSGNAGISDLHTTSLALSPAYVQDTKLWITSASGVFQSNNGGASWIAGAPVARTMSELVSSHYKAIAAGATGSGPVLYLGMYEGLWSSSDGAFSWRYIDTLPTRLIRYLSLSPNFVKDRTVFASTYGGGNIWSSDGGSSWSVRNTGMKGPYTDASGISRNYAVDGTAFSSDENGLQKSTDRGNTWVLMPEPGAGAYPRALAISPAFAQDATVLIGLTPETSLSALYRSTDGGNTWVAAAPAGAVGIVSIALSPAFSVDRTAIAASSTTGAYKSNDGGLTWNLMSGLPATEVAIVAFSPSFAADRTMFAAGTEGGIFKSVDGGATWSTLNYTNSLRALSLAVSPNYAADQSLFAGTLQKGLVKFTKGGSVMVPVTSFPDNFVTAIGISPGFASDHTIYGAGYHGLFKSKDGGSTWAYASEPSRIEDSQNSNGPLEEPPVITYRGNWLEMTQPAASSNTFMQTGAAQAAAVLDFTGSGVAWVGSTGPQQGSAALRLDGVSKGNVSLTGPANLYQQVIWQIKGLPCGRHTLVITAQSAAPVAVDAFDVWVNYCPMQ